MRPRTVCFLPLLLLVLLVAGCSRYQMDDLRASLAEGDFQTAWDALAEHAPRSLNLPYLFEYGLVAHYAGRYPESNRAFEIAEQIAEDLYTVSIRRELASLMTSDNARPYAGTRYERLLTHYYRALNYVYLHQPDEALVECRRAERLLQFYADEDPNYNFAGAAFMAYLSGILYESTGDWNDAYIAYRWAEAGYRQYEQTLGIPMPADIGESLVRLARRLGFADEAAEYAARYGDPPPRDPNEGELVLFYESGFVPQKVEENLLLPILKGDPVDEEEEVWDLAGKLVRRRHLAYDEDNLEYLLRVAIPRYTTNPPRLTGLLVSAGERQASSALVEDVERIAHLTFASEQQRILLRTVARALVKYLAYRRARKEGRVVGWLVNAFNVATERADTRSWETLPNRISRVRLPLPAGTYDLRLVFLDAQGRQVHSQILEDVRIRPGRKTILNYRTFE